MHAGRLRNGFRACRTTSTHTGQAVPAALTFSEPSPHGSIGQRSSWFRACRHQSSSLATAGVRRWQPRRQVLTYCTTAAEQSASVTGASDVSTGASATSPPPSVNGVFETRYGSRWRIRPYDNSDYDNIIDVQADSFHNKNPVSFLNDFTYRLFRAEVVDALQQKTKFSACTGDVFQLLVAEEAPAAVQADAGATCSSSGSGNGSNRCGVGSGARGALVGSVEVSRLRDAGVLSSLPPGAKEYVYVSSMCIRRSVRRRGAAQALLAAAEAQARLWRQPHFALHVYRDNTAAVQLYSSWGMRVVATDPEWKQLVGDRVRLLMYKAVDVQGAGTEVEQRGGDSPGGASGAGQAMQVAVGLAALTVAVGCLFATGAP